MRMGDVAPDDVAGVLVGVVNMLERIVHGLADIDARQKWEATHEETLTVIPGGELVLNRAERTCCALEEMAKAMWSIARSQRSMLEALLPPADPDVIEPF